MVFDEARLARYVQTYAARLTIDPESAVVVERDGTFEVVEGTEGRVADRIAPTEYLTAALADIDAPSEIRVDLEVSSVTPDVTTQEATAAMALANKLSADIPVVAGKESWTIPTAQIHKWITFATGAEGTYAPVVSRAMLTGVDVDARRPGLDHGPERFVHGQRQQDHRRHRRQERPGARQRADGNPRRGPPRCPSRGRGGGADRACRDIDPAEPDDRRGPGGRGQDEEDLDLDDLLLHHRAQ